jgi:ribosomal protein S18 acetylase RimI-like enzyme
MTLGSLRMVPPGADRDRYLPLLYLADDSAAQVHSYYQLGDLYAVDGAAGSAVAIMLAIAQPGGIVELKSVAVATSLQRQGIGRQFLAAVLEDLQRNGTRRVIVGTSSSSIGPFAFYQRAGFRVCKVERDFFSPARGYANDLEENGIPVRDILWLDLDLPDTRSG